MKTKKEKEEHYKRYGWKCNEKNLESLPSSAPESAKQLTQWLTLAGRKSSLEEWLGVLESDGKIHGTFWHIGAWTHRMSHSKPNQANIPSVWPSEVPPKNVVEEIKERYDERLRECYEASPWLVGTDAESIQLRVLAHLMNSPAYIRAIEEGDKSLGTDVHTLNMKALGPVCRSRDASKTFIYAWILGASNPKIAEILECSTAEAKEAVDNFLRALPELKKLKDFQVKRDAKRGYFIGLDGRKVPCTSEHLMLAGYLQNGEAVIMKHATIEWLSQLKKTAIPFNLLNFVHDEWQTRVGGSYEDADYVGKAQCQALVDTGERLGLNIKLAGAYSIGKNWRDTH